MTRVSTMHTGKKITHSQPEFDYQCAIFQWRKFQLNVYPELKYMFSTLNGVRVSIGTATKMKRAGMTRGIVDIILPAKNKYYSSLFVELKHGDNKPSKDQLDYISFLNKQGHLALVCWGFEEAINVIENYLMNIERSF